VCLCVAAVGLWSERRPRVGGRVRKTDLGASFPRHAALENSRHHPPESGVQADGLAVLVRAAEYRVVDSQPILFHDCADRVAQLVHVGAPALQ